MNIVILTATYNRCNEIGCLFKTLLEQSNQSFRWIIIDDGSTDKTRDLVLSWATIPHSFEIVYKHKTNSGKSKSINVGLSMIRDSDFVAIIDDDEHLYPDAIDTINCYAEKYKNSDCVGMEFLRDCAGKPISNYAVGEDFFMSVQERKKKGLEIDGYACYYGKYVSTYRFPEYDGEKYVGPGVLQMICSNNHRLLWPSKSLGFSSYLEGGITKQGRALRLKNPKGMIKYCSLLQDKKSGFRIRLKYSIMGYAYISYSKIKKKDLINCGLDKHGFLKFCYLPGLILAAIWRNRNK